MRPIKMLIGLAWARLQENFSLWAKLIGLQILVGFGVVVGFLALAIVIAVIFAIIAKAGMLLAIGGGLLIFALIIIGMWGLVYFGLGAFLAMQVAMRDEGKVRPIFDYYREGRGYVLRSLTASLWAFLLLGLSVLLPIAAIALLAIVVKGVAAVAVLAIGFIVTAALFTFLLVKLVPASFVVVAEGLGGRATVRRSFELVKGHWWRTAMVIGAIQIIAFVISTAFDLLIGTVGRSGLLAIILSLLSIVASFLTAPWLLAVLWEYYKDLASEKPQKV